MDVRVCMQPFLISVALQRAKYFSPFLEFVFNLYY